MTTTGTSKTTDARRRGWTLAIVSIGLFMVVLDNLVVNVALPSIHRDLGGLDPVARVDRQRLRARVRGPAADRAPRSATASAASACSWPGSRCSPLSSAAAALAPSTGPADRRPRDLQGVGAAIVTPLTLTLLADAFPPERRGVALGVWSGISGIAVALGPLVGGAVIQAGSWHWIFWINVPIGVALVPLAGARLAESHGPDRAPRPARARARLDRPVRDRVRARPLAVARLGRALEVTISLVAGRAAGRGVHRPGAARTESRCCR